MKWPWQKEPARPLCAGGCNRRATHLACYANLIALTCVVCAGLAQAHEEATVSEIPRA